MRPNDPAFELLLRWSRPNIFGHGVPFAWPRSPDTGPGLTSVGKELVRACNRLGVMIDLAHLNEQGFRDVAKLSPAPLVATHACVQAICPSTRNLTVGQLDAIRETDRKHEVELRIADSKSFLCSHCYECFKSADRVCQHLMIWSLHRSILTKA